MGAIKKLIIYLAFLFVINISAQTFTEKTDLLSGQESISFLAITVSAIDFDNDGLVDIYFPQSDTAGILYKNIGESGFINVINESGIDDIPDNSLGSWGGIWGDYNNDGLIDAYFVNAYNLFRNNGDGSFENTTSEAGISIIDSSFFQGIAWADFNLDGKLDLFLGEDNGRNKILVNVNNQFLLNDINANVQTIEGTYGVAAGDLNGDNFPEIFIGACRAVPSLSRNHLLLNNQNGTFTNIGSEAGIDDSLAAWGVVFIDYDNDMDNDVFVANMHIRNSTTQPGFNKLYRNDGDLRFTDIAVEAGVAGDTEDRSFGIATADFNNDGWYDLLETNTNGSDIRLFINNKDGTFSLSENPVGSFLGSTSNLAVADFNNDGWIDIITNMYRLFMNDGGSNTWISIKAQGEQSNYFGVGTRIEVYAGSLQQMREINAGDGFICQNHNLSAHFGLGENSIIDSIVVRWPASGIVDRYHNVNVNQHITVIEGHGQVTSVTNQNSLPSEFRLHQNYPNPFNPSTVISYQLSKAGHVELIVFDILGNEIKQLVSKQQQPGSYSAIWNGTNNNDSPVPSGTYFYRALFDGKFSETKKLLFIK